MQTFPTLVVCAHWDRVCRRRALVTREMARCGQSSAVLYRASQLDVDR
jgi:paraquat-inducible protein A